MTDDSFKDRYPRWSPGGQHIAFYSNRSGKFEIWMIRSDGSGLERISDWKEDVFYPIWSPDQKRMAASTDTATVIFNLSSPLPVKKFEKLPPASNSGDVFQPYSWSPDGKWIAGSVDRPGGMFGDLFLYSIESGKLEKLIDTNSPRSGPCPVWFQDNRTILYLQTNKEISVVDRITKKSTKIYSPVSTSYIIDG